MTPSNKRRWIFFAFVVVAGAILVLRAFTSGKWEPVYHGKTVSYWIEQMGWRNSQNGFIEPSNEAEAGFSRTNAEALPFLIAALEVREPWRDRLLDKLRHILPAALARHLPMPTFDAGLNAR